MAFHVACPITCRKICFCPLGFPRDLSKRGGEEAFLNDVARIEELLRDSSSIRAIKGATVQVLVPKVVPPPPPPPPITLHLSPLPPPKLVAVANVGDGGGGGGDRVEDESAAAVSAQTKRVALQKKAAAAMVAAEDYARRFEAGDVAVALKDATGEEQSLSNSNVFCRMCFLGEKEGSERARRMLSCKTCGKKYHRNCLKSWAQHRDLFHWSSWTCPSCRICEICRKVGDPSKFMFCKRCDGAFHCYCQHPPHKNVSSGPYLCPKHTRCHSCGSNVPGNGLSVRWFLGYTCCDACGRLFVKGNYCPVCLKVYRDSESTPMVCCDICQRWVHCRCDGISDEKYLRYQVDRNLQYKCATCRGECYQVKDLEDAVQELWRRRDKADRDLIASLRAAAGLPTRDDIFLISPYSDDEENGPVRLKNECGRSLKLSLKGLAEKSSKKSKENGKKSWKKKSSKKKGYQASLVDKMEPEHLEIEQNGQGFDYTENDNAEPHGEQGLMSYSSRVAGIVNHTDMICSINQPAVLKHKLVDEVMVIDGERKSRIVKIRSKRPHDLESGDDTENQAKSNSVKAKKLVINLGPRKINVTNSPRSDTSSCQREQDLTTSNGSDDAGNRLILNANDGNVRYRDGDTGNNIGQVGGLKFARREENLIKYGRIKSESSNLNPKFERGLQDNRHEAIPPENKYSSLGEKSSDEGRVVVGHDDSVEAPVMQSSKPSKFSLKLKIKKPDLENQNSRIPVVEEEKSSIRGQRSKRKRSSAFTDRIVSKDDKDAQAHNDSRMMEASWILRTLGKDAIGKRVEVHQPSDNSWHRGVVSDVTEGTSMLSVSLDDGSKKILELGKQPVRFIPQKQKRSGL